MASVAKWLRQRIVVPPFVGSSPIVRPYFQFDITPSSPISMQTWLDIVRGL